MEGRVVPGAGSTWTLAAQPPTTRMVRFETIDCHAHVGHFEGYDLSEETLLSELHRGDVALALVSNVDGAAVPGKTLGLDEVQTNRATTEAVRRHPDRLRGLLWARPEIGSAEALEPFLRERLPRGEAEPWTERVFVGVKLHPEMNGFAADDPRVDPYLALAGRHRMPVVFHCDGQVEEASAERIYRLARRHPGVPVVLYHMGFGGPHDASLDAAREARERRDARLYLDTAQVPVEVVLDALERVGPDRILFGTDATYYGRGHYERYRALRAALAGMLEPAELCAILSRNARTLFRLTHEDHT